MLFAMYHGDQCGPPTMLQIYSFSAMQFLGATMECVYILRRLLTFFCARYIVSDTRNNTAQTKQPHI
jgi:hypothetical protein